MAEKSHVKAPEYCRVEREHQQAFKGPYRASPADDIGCFSLLLILRMTSAYPAAKLPKRYKLKPNLETEQS